nr:MAG TPA: hypothetical protein [Caudoviricetes sp.]
MRRRNGPAMHPSPAGRRLCGGREMRRPVARDAGVFDFTIRGKGRAAGWKHGRGCT